MSSRYLDWAIDCNRVEGRAKRLLMHIARRSNGNGICWPSHATLAQECGCTRRHVIRLVDRLEQAGLVEVARRKHTWVEIEAGAPYKKTNIYRIVMLPNVPEWDEDEVDFPEEAEEVIEFSESEHISDAELAELFNLERSSFKSNGAQLPLFGDESQGESPEMSREMSHELTSSQVNSFTSVKELTCSRDFQKSKIARPDRSKIKAMTGELVALFSSLTKISAPEPKTRKEWAATQELWYKPLEHLLLQAGYEMRVASFMVREATSSMRKQDLSIFTPKSIEAMGISAWYYKYGPKPPKSEREQEHFAYVIGE